MGCKHKNKLYLSADEFWLFMLSSSYFPIGYVFVDINKSLHLIFSLSLLRYLIINASCNKSFSCLNDVSSWTYIWRTEKRDVHLQAFPSTSYKIIFSFSVFFGASKSTKFSHILSFINLAVQLLKFISFNFRCGCKNFALG